MITSTFARSTKMLNGVDLTQLGENIHSIRQDPQLADFTFRAKNTWINGGHNWFAIKGFYGNGKEDTGRSRAFTYDADEPPVLLGNDAGPNPVEYLLGALSACMTTSLAYHAAALGYKIDSIESEYEGDIDIQGFLGLRPDVRKGYKSIRVKFRVKGDIPEAVITELACRSPVLDTVMNGTCVELEAEKA